MEPEVLQKSLGLAVRAAREKLKLSRDTLAELAELDVRVLASIEQGRLMPQVPTLRSLALSLKVSTDELLGMDRPEVPLVGMEPEAAEVLRQAVSILRHWGVGQLKKLLKVLAALTDSPPAA
jgi:ribosome-binding protein aMBF1 (putative translation factor)